MEVNLTYLPRLDIGPGLGEPGSGKDHPMRHVTNEVAFSSKSWSSERAAKIASLFDELAPSWEDKDFSARGLPVFDALERGGVTRGIVGIELGSGTGAYSSLLSKYFETLLCIDISYGMLIQSRNEGGTRIRGDGACLPVADGSVDAVFCINTLLFPDEMERILAPAGYLVWVSTNGADTPIYLSPSDCLRALGNKFVGVTSESGAGTWTVIRRT